MINRCHVTRRQEEGDVAGLIRSHTSVGVRRSRHGTLGLIAYVSLGTWGCDNKTTGASDASVVHSSAATSVQGAVPSVPGLVATASQGDAAGGIDAASHADAASPVRGNAPANPFTLADIKRDVALSLAHKVPSAAQSSLVSTPDKINEDTIIAVRDGKRYMTVGAYLDEVNSVEVNLQLRGSSLRNPDVENILSNEFQKNNTTQPVFVDPPPAVTATAECTPVLIPEAWVGTKELRLGAKSSAVVLQASNNDGAINRFEFALGAIVGGHHYTVLGVNASSQLRYNGTAGEATLSYTIMDQLVNVPGGILTADSEVWTSQIGKDKTIQTPAVEALIPLWWGLFLKLGVYFTIELIPTISAESKASYALDHASFTAGVSIHGFADVSALSILDVGVEGRGGLTIGPSLDSKVTKAGVHVLWQRGLFIDLKGNLALAAHACFDLTVVGLGRKCGSVDIIKGEVPVIREEVPGTVRTVECTPCKQECTPGKCNIDPRCAVACPCAGNQTCGVNNQCVPPWAPDPEPCPCSPTDAPMPKGMCVKCCNGQLPKICPVPGRHDSDNDVVGRADQRDIVLKVSRALHRDAVSAGRGAQP